MTKTEQEVLDAPARVAEYSSVDAGLAELREKVSNTAYDIKTTAGDKVARSLRAECVTLRTSIEAKRLEAKRPLLAKGKLLDDEANRIKAEILVVEKPLDTAIKAEETRKADEKAAKDRVDAEARRKIDQAISDIAFIPVYATGKTAQEIENLGVELAARELGADEFGDRTSEAGIARGAALEKLRTMHAAAVAAEQQAADLERVRKEQAAEAERIRQANADLAQRESALAEQRSQQRQDAIGETLDAGTKAMLAPLASTIEPPDGADTPGVWAASVTLSREEAEEMFPPPADGYEAAEREHLGNAFTGTGIYSGQRAVLQAIGQQESPGGGSGARGTFMFEDAADTADAAPGPNSLIGVIADFYDVPPFTAEAWLRAAFGGQQ